MARMHSGSKGSSGSTKPAEKKLPSWVTYKAKEVEALVVKAAKKNLSGSQIGGFLRDTYGIPSVKLITNKNISSILNEKGASHELPEDLLSLIRKALKVRKHITENNQDKTSKRGLVLTESKIKRLTKYYKSTGKVRADWKYDPKAASIYIE